MVYVNNFRYGEISKKNAGRFDTEAYSQGAFSFINASTLTEGGVTRRPPLKSVYDDDERLDTDSVLRIIPFSLSESMSMAIGLCKEKICVFRLISGKLFLTEIADYPSTESTQAITMTDSMARGACYAQYYNRMYFASQDFRPFFLDFDTTTMTFTVSYVSVILNQDAKKRVMFTPQYVADADGNELTALEGRYLFIASDGNYYFDEDLTDKYEYRETYPPVYGSSTYISSYDEYADDDLLVTTNDYPAIVAVIADSLWFASTRNNPATLWKSRILGSSQWVTEYSSDSMHDFTQFQQVTTESVDVVDQEDLPMTEAIGPDGTPYYEEESGNPKWYACSEVDGVKTYHYRIYKNYTAGGDSTKFYYDSACTSVWTPTEGMYASKKPYMVYDLSNYDQLFLTKTNMDFVTTSSCACRVSFNTGRLDKITFIKEALEKIIVGTTTGEEVLPSSFAPGNLTRSHLSEHGSLQIQAMMLNTSLLFLQRDNIVRELYLYEGYINNTDITAYSKDVVNGTVRIMVTKNTPYPNAYILMDDGSMRVLTYDKQVGIQAFSRWTFDGIAVKSLATIDNGNSQILVALCDIDGKKRICYFDESEKEEFKDLGEHGYTTEIETVYAEIINNSLTFGRYKKAKVMWIRPYETGHMMLGCDRRQLTKTRHTLGSEDYRHTILGAASSQFSIVMQSVDAEPMTLLAMAWEVDNGNNV